jgi:antitoxin PrlF
VTSKITAKGQTTIPKEIRQALHAGAGDTLAYEIQPNGAVQVRKVAALDVAWHQAVAEAQAAEWDSPEDTEAFRDL